MENGQEKSAQIVKKQSLNSQRNQEEHGRHKKD